MNDPYPWGLGELSLPLGDIVASAPDIVIGTRIRNPAGQWHLFASSGLVKTALETAIQRDFPRDTVVHPAALELRAIISTITFLERVAITHNYRWTYPKVIESDNWGTLTWAFIHIFERGAGFIARWDDDANLEWDNAPRFPIDSLTVSSLPEDCGKRFSTAAGEIVLEYVNSL